MNSVGGVATERRPPQPTQQQFLANYYQQQLFLSQTNATIIDDSQFPSLGAKGSPSLGGGFSPIPTTSGGVLNVAQSSPSRDPYRTNYANLMRSDPNLTNPEFQIQNEDFPALPGVGVGQSQRQLLGDQLANMLPSDRVDFVRPLVGDCDASLGGLSRNSQEGPMNGIQTHPDGEVTNIPASMLDDQFGMAGLVTYLRTVDNPSIVSLALGYDLTTLGLNLNLSERKLYMNFGGPWADSPIQSHELDVRVPEEYLTHNSIRDKLQPLRLNKLSEDVLFYLFYNCPNEIYQVTAACELYHREWRYHKSEGAWLTRSQYGTVKEQTSAYEKGSYNVFDQMQWRKIPKEMKLEYNQLEERPRLPNSIPGQSPYFFQGPQFPSCPATGLMVQLPQLLVSSGQVTPPTGGGGGPPLNGVVIGGGGGNNGVPGGPPIGGGGAAQQAARATPN